MRPLCAAVLIFLVAIVMPPLLASQAVGPTSCTMAGVWYGGGPDAKYMLTITADSGQHYTMSGAAAFTQASLGYPVTTTFSNSIVKTGAGWEFFGAGMVNQSAAFPAPDPEVWALHGTARLVGCDTLSWTTTSSARISSPAKSNPS